MKHAQRFRSFFLAPAGAEPLAALRIGVTSVLLLQAFLLLPDLHELYGEQGILQGAISRHLLSAWIPQLGWFEGLFARFGVSGDQTLSLLCVAYVTCVATLLIGYRTRLFAFLTWLLHFTLIYDSGGLTAYGVDSFAHLLLFYFFLMPVGAAWSVDAARKIAFPAPEYNRLSLRVLQIHTCVAYFVAGVAKGAGAQWWNGEAIWRATMMPDFAKMDSTWMANVGWFPLLVGWGTVLMEAGYPLLVWFRRTRPFLVLGIVLMHVGIFFVMGLKTFALLMIALNVALFLVPASARSSARGPQSR